MGIRPAEGYTGFFGKPSLSLRNANAAATFLVNGVAHMPETY